MIVPVRVVRCFPNNNPWITCDIKGLLNQKKAAFRENDREKSKQVQQELKRSLKMAKVDYKKVERKLQHNDTRDVWRGMKNSQATAGDVDKANEFNLFYNKFDTATVACSASPSLPSASPASAPSSTPGPDDVCPRLLKVCADQLAEPLQWLFNLSLQVGRVPVLVPVPKAGRLAELNHYRPVALASHIMKTLERLILCHLRPQTIHALDPLQFRYWEHIGVDNTVLCLLHRAYSYLDEPGSRVRIMFFDFSSAFNTIQPLLL